MKLVKTGKVGFNSTRMQFAGRMSPGGVQTEEWKGQGPGKG